MKDTRVPRGTVYQRSKHQGTTQNSDHEVLSRPDLSALFLCVRCMSCCLFRFFYFCFCLSVSLCNIESSSLSDTLKLKCSFSCRLVLEQRAGREDTSSNFGIYHVPWNVSDHIRMGVGHNVQKAICPHPPTYPSIPPTHTPTHTLLFLPSLSLSRVQWKEGSCGGCLHGGYRV